MYLYTLTHDANLKKKTIHFSITAFSNMANPKKFETSFFRF